MLNLLSRRFSHNCKSLIKHPHYCKIFCPLCYEEGQEMLESGVNYFKLFLLPETYSIDKATLSQKYRAFQKILHPDKLRAHGFTNPNYSKFLYQAYKTLEDDVERGKYLMELMQESVGELEVKDVDFLEEQLEKRALLFEEGEEEAKEVLDEVKGAIQEITGKIEKCFNKGDWASVKDLLGKLSFMRKLELEARHKACA